MLPLPEVDVTLAKLKESVRVSAEGTEGEGELNSFYAAVDRFVASGAAAAAHGEIRDLAREVAARNGAGFPGSWIEKLWLEAYLSDGNPLPININPHFVLDSAPSSVAAASAAATATGMLDWWAGVLAEPQAPGAYIPLERRPELMGSIEVSAWSKVMGFARLPRTEAAQPDTAHVYDPTTDGAKLGVVCNGHYYTVEPVMASDFSGPMPVELLARTMEAIQDDAHSRAPGWASGTEVGVFTALPRLEWGMWRARFAASSPAAAAFLSEWDSSLFVVALDSAPLSGRSMMHGMPAAGTFNRWFDKMLVAADPSGRVGFRNEHSFLDGIVWKHMIDAAAPELGARARASRKPGAGLPWQRHEFTLPPELAADMRRAQEAAAASADSVQLVEIEDERGAASLAKSLGLSPDAFVQLALQATFAAMEQGMGRAGSLRPGVYEAATMQGFWRGRTETIRSLTEASVAAVWGEPLAYSGDALRAAGQAHTATIKAAMEGDGIDRHLYMLQSVAGDNGNELFSHPLLTNASRWRVSTSNISSPHLGFIGFGAVDPDGLGLGYNQCADGLRLAISGFNASDAVNVDIFAGIFPSVLSAMIDALRKS